MKSLVIESSQRNVQQFNHFGKVSFVFGRDVSMTNEKVDDYRARRCFELGRKDSLETFRNREQLKSLNLKRTNLLKDFAKGLLIPLHLR